MTRYWTARYGTPHEVFWREPGASRAALHSDQRWYCNRWLNIVFTPDAEPRAFAPVQREYARSLVRWRRPIQSAYVKLATSPPTARWLAHATMHVSPPIAKHQRQVIVPGNNKIRILDHVDWTATSILKDGFGRDGFERELRSRKIARQLGLPVIEVLDEDTSGGWFRERYVAATPVNRLSNKNTMRDVVHNACFALRGYLEHSLKSNPMPHYINELEQRIRVYASSQPLLADAQRSAIDTALDELLNWANQSSTKFPDHITTSIGHGDFQAANVLVDGQEFWLIDWESSRRRQTGYDPLVMGLGSRTTRDLVRSMQAFIQRGWTSTLLSRLDDWPGFAWRSSAQRRCATLVFLLEELDYHFEENSNRLFTRLGDGLTRLVADLPKLVAGIRLEPRSQ